MTLNEYQDAAISAAIYPREYAVIYPALKLAGEAGEVAEKIGKRIRDNEADFVSSEFRREIAKELGDVLWYISAIGADLGIDLNSIAHANLEKLASRKERGVIGGSGDNR